MQRGCILPALDVDEKGSWTTPDGTPLLQKPAHALVMLFSIDEQLVEHHKPCSPLFVY